MTTIIIFLPTARHLINRLCFKCILKTLESGNVILQETLAQFEDEGSRLLILCFTTVAFGDDFKLGSGKEYKNVTVTRVEPDGIVLKTKSGISKVYFGELQKEVQERFHYNAAIANTSHSIM